MTSIFSRPLFRSSFLVSLLAASLVGSTSGARAQEASVIADDPPIETGLKMERNGVAPSQVSVDGKTVKTWVSVHKSVPADEWARSFFFTFTDERFKNGKAPAVDIEVTYWHEANTSVQLLADTADGSRKIGEGWGNQKKFQTIKVRIANAYFGARNHGNAAKDLPTDGYDLRLNAWAGDFHLRSIRATIVDPNAITDWTPFLQMSDGQSAHGWVLEPGGSDDIRFDVKNSAPKSIAGEATWEVFDLYGKSLRSSQAPFNFVAGGSTPLAYRFDAKELPADEYSVRLTLRLKGGNPDQPFYARERSVMVAAKEDVFILFDKEPVMRGMDFNREGMSATEIEINGVKRWMWRSDATFGAQPWWRSAKFNVTDPRFTAGKRPVTDVRFTYRHAPNAPVNMSGQSATGPRQIIGSWGNNSNWSTAETHFDDAVWGAPKDSGDPNKMMPDGADLRLTANSGNAEIRSVRVRGYDLDVPNWNRLIRYDGLDAGHERYIFAPGQKQEIKIKLFNLSNKPFAAHATLGLRDDLGGTLWNREQDATLAPRTLGTVPVSFDTTGMKQGMYLLDLEMKIGKTGDKLVGQEVNLLVSESTPIARAKPGEFLFGMDTGGSWRDDWLLGWAQFAGADSLRTSNASLEEMEEAQAKLKGLGLQAAHMPVPEWKTDENERRRRTKEIAENAAQIARRFPQTVYFEVGNEPDLTYFYGGPTSAYVEDYIVIYDAIKAANPKAIVTNGGLCFAGEEGDRRAREIIKLIPKDKIDAWAYHAHGPGAQAERAMLHKIRDEAAKWGKADIPFIETESGVAAGTLMQQRMQARTAIQKLTYAQSEKLPVFVWFRTHITGGDGGYTSVKNGNEARSVILSYRTTVQTLRGHRFARRVDLGSDDYEGYLFVQNGPNGEQDKTGTGRVLVAWANARGGARRNLQVSNARNVRRIDMFGNVETTNKTAEISGITIDSDPVFLAWNSTAAAASVRVLPSMLEVSPTTYLAPQSRDAVAVVVKNPSDQPLKASLEVSVAAQSGIAPIAPIAVELAPGASKTISVPLQVGSAPETINWPKRWTVFVPLVPDKIDLSKIAAIPGSLQIGDATIRPQMLNATENRIDIAPISGGIGDRKESVIFAEVDSPRAQTIKIGASADWYMEWFVNGKREYSTIEGGNAGAQSMLSHVFPITLQAGRNLLAVRVLSGSQGWNFLSGGPQELAEAQGTQGTILNRLTFALKGEGKTEPISLESSRIAFAAKVGAAPEAWSTPAAWQNVAPSSVLGEVGVQNPFSIQPDAARWWQGSDDLSARAWLRADAKNVFIAVAVRDDVHRAATGTPGANGDFASGDAVRLAFSSEGKTLDLALAGDGTLSRRDGNAWQTLDAAAGVLRAVRVETLAPRTTWYFAQVARELLPGARWAFNAVALDDDWGVRKQWAPIADGFDAGLNLSLTTRQTDDWPRFVLAP